MRQNRRYQIFLLWCSWVRGLGFRLDIENHNFKFLDMVFMKKFRIQSDCKISISVHRWCLQVASPLQHSLECLLNLSLREQLLLPVLDMFSMGWVGICSYGVTAVAEVDLRPSILQLNAEGLTASKSPLSSSKPIRTRHSSSSYRRPTAQLQTSYRRDPLHDCRQTDSQLLTSWVSREKETRFCQVCPQTVGMVTGR